MKQCKIELMEGLNAQVNFDLNGEQPEIYDTFLINADGEPVQFKPSEELCSNIMELVKEEVSSISFGDSTIIDI